MTWKLVSRLFRRVPLRLSTRRALSRSAYALLGVVAPATSRFRRHLDFRITQAASLRPAGMEPGGLPARNGSAPDVSVIVPIFNALPFVKACLHSLERFDTHPSWELILVDDGSGPDTASYLDAYVRRSSDRVRLIRQANGGFSRACNAGAAAASGAYLVFLNSDTYVTERWLERMVEHFRADPKLGLLTPVSNNVWNEARVPVRYRDMEEMVRLAAQRADAFSGTRRPLARAAFFCAMTPRSVWDEAGRLDEGYGRGYFEDDDYSLTVRGQDRSIACAENVLVHHHLAATFDRVDESARQAAFDEGGVRFASKWSDAQNPGSLNGK